MTRRHGGHHCGEISSRAVARDDHPVAVYPVLFSAVEDELYPLEYLPDMPRMLRRKGVVVVDVRGDKPLVHPVVAIESAVGTNAGEEPSPVYVDKERSFFSLSLRQIHVQFGAPAVAVAQPALLHYAAVHAKTRYVQQQFAEREYRLRAAHLELLTAGQSHNSPYLNIKI